MGNKISKSLVEIERELSSITSEVLLTGDDLKVSEVISVARNNSQVVFTKNSKVLNRIKQSYKRMMQDVSKGIPVYGCNTAYGARASRVLNGGSKSEKLDFARKLSEGIVHVDVSVGPAFEKDVVRGAMLIRMNMLMKGVSAVRIEDLEIYRQLLNSEITPIVNQYGGIGASGDLAHNGRVLSVARQLDGAKVWDRNGRIRGAAKVLEEEKIPPLKLDPKAGLAFVNGDNFSSSLAVLLIYDTLQLLLISSVVGALVIEVLGGTDRSFHPLLGGVRPHSGQKEVASLYRYLLKRSKLAWQEMKGHKVRASGVRVQDAYSLRGISQYHSVNFEKIKLLLEVTHVNINSASDNPLWVSPEFKTPGEKPWQWVSGGNFLAAHMAEAMDGLRKIMTQIVKLNDRHLTRMVSLHESNGLPPNLSDEEALTGCAFKGVQIQSGMFDVYSSLLSIPVTTFFGIHEEGNQDITSHALTSGILGLENLRIARYSTAQNLLAVSQAVDHKGGPGRLSPRTRPVYEFVRERVAYVKKEKPLHNEIEILYESIKNGDLMQILRDKTFKEYTNEE